MPKTKVNNNIELKAGGGVLNDATNGLSVDAGTTANKVVQLDANAKLPAVDGSLIKNISIYYPGTGLLASSDTEFGFTESVYTKKREIKVIGGTYTVKFEGTDSNTTVAYAQIYVNGVAVGIERELVVAYNVYSEDLTFQTGDLVQLYTKRVSGTTPYVKNFRIYGNQFVVNL